ncbi:hypothetical protein Taro_036223 [Colocasia esculenta]|uniref:SAC domain-containing protein n=1 Tax=Colocasia esculenta TaxID=4460 RepID=A0A843WL08_COLES|nr:hypothetical protein [Colocasia esculenta]
MTVAATLNMIRKMSAKYSRNVRFRRHRTQRASSCPLPLTNAHTLPSRRGPPRLLPPTPLQNPAIRLALLCPPALPVPPHFPPSSLFNYPCPVIAPPPSLSVFPTKTPISAAPDCLSTIALHTLLRGFSITTAPDDSPSLPLVSLHRRRSRRSPTSAVHTGDLRQLPSLLRSSVLQPGQTQSRRLSSSDLLFTRPTHEVVGCRRIRRRRTDRNVSIRPLSWVLDRAAPGGSAHRWTDYLGREFCLSCRRSGPPSGSHIFGAMEKSDSAKKLCTKMRLWEFPDQYIIEPTDGILDSYLAVSRADGSMNLIRTYLMVITECERVGSYLGHAIFKVSSLQTLPCNNSMKTSSSEQKKMEAELSTLLNAAERSHGLYFSYDVNLTLSLQRLHALDPESKLLPLWRQADPRFLWNNYMLEALIDNKPRVTERHFMDLRKRYGSVLAVDLVNKHGSEGRLSEKFASAMQHMRSEDIQYIHFDFHRICGHIRFERLSQLYDQMKDYINKQGYFLLNPSGEKVNEQQGIVRTNCIDCLDRTNVTQKKCFFVSSCTLILIVLEVLKIFK